MLLISFTPPSVESSELVLKLIVVMLNYLETGAIIIVCLRNLRSDDSRGVVLRPILPESWQDHT